MTLEFPNPPVAVDPVVTEIRLPGHDAKTGEDVECRITAKALMEHCGAKEPTDKEFTGKMKENTGDVLFRWNDLPREELMDGAISRAGFRGDNALIVFNWIQPARGRPEPHSHPFDQILLILEGRLMLEIDGQTMECDPGSIVHVPANAMHTGWALGDRTVLNMDVFSPIREDYLHLTKYQKEFA